MTETPHSSHAETESKYLIPIVGTFPGMDPSVLDTYTMDGIQALILESNAHAALAATLRPKIKEISERGIPVIVLADNNVEAHGVTHVVDEPQAATLNSGAFYLETIGIGSPNAEGNNQDNLTKVVNVVKEAVDQGLSGKELGEFVRQRFSYPVGKKPSRPDPVTSLRAHHEKLIGLKLGGLTETQLEQLEKAEAARK